MDYYDVLNCEDGNVKWELYISGNRGKGWSGEIGSASNCGIVYLYTKYINKNLSGHVIYAQVIAVAVG